MTRPSVTRAKEAAVRAAVRWNREWSTHRWAMAWEPARDLGFAVDRLERAERAQRKAAPKKTRRGR